MYKFKALKDSVYKVIFTRLALMHDEIHRGTLLLIRIYLKSRPNQTLF